MTDDFRGEVIDQATLGVGVLDETRRAAERQAAALEQMAAAAVEAARRERAVKGDKGDKGDQGDQGDRGVQGIHGDPGPKGDNGEPGTDGAAGERGLRGFQGNPGKEGPPGLTGEPGTDGRTVLNGDGPPSDRRGKNDDWYIDRLAKTIYGPKGPDGWGQPTSLKGPPGQSVTAGGFGGGGGQQVIYDDGVRIGVARDIDFQGGDPVTIDHGIARVPVGSGGGGGASGISFGQDDPSAGAGLPEPQLAWIYRRENLDGEAPRGELWLKFGEGDDEWVRLLTVFDTPATPTLGAVLLAGADAGGVQIDGINGLRATVVDAEADGSIIATSVGTGDAHVNVRAETDSGDANANREAQSNDGSAVANTSATAFGGDAQASVGATVFGDGNATGGRTATITGDGVADISDSVQVQAPVTGFAQGGIQLGVSNGVQFQFRPRVDADGTVHLVLVGPPQAEPVDANEVWFLGNLLALSGLDPPIAFVDPPTATPEALANALIAAGLMAAA